VRQLLTESFVLAVAGSIAGIVVAAASSRLFASLAPASVVSVAPVRIDWRVLSFTLLAAILTGFVFGLAPALHASRPGLTQALREESGRTSATASRQWLRHGLVVAQVALCLILLIGAGLFLQSLRRGLQLDPGFQPDNLVLAGFDVFPLGYDRVRGTTFFARVLERMRAIRGVEQAALARTVPLGFGGNSSTGLHIEGYEPRKDEEVVVSYNEVSEGYFETMGIPIVAGRTFTVRDVADTPSVMIVNQTMARRYWPKGDPVGRFVGIGKERIQVVGVVRDGKYRSLTERPTSYMYFPLPQSYRSAVKLHVRSAMAAGPAIEAIRQAFHELDPDLPVTETVTMDQHMEEAVFAQRIAATLLSIFGGLALTLAAVGLYSVMSYAVSQRTHEMGIRLALGASPGELRRMVVRSGMRVAIVGLVIGAVGAAGVSQLLTSLLNGVSPTDPITFSVVVALLGAIAFAAAFIPARRASSVDPVVALRYD